MYLRLLACGLLLAPQTLLAQTVVVPAPMQTQNVTVVQQQAVGNVLRAGAPVPVVLSQFLTTKGKGLKVGQRVQLEVAQDVLLNGRVVIPARSPVEGVLTHVRNKGMWGTDQLFGLVAKQCNGFRCTKVICFTGDEFLHVRAGF